MKKIILITGATDGIGFETAKSLISQGHTVLLHGRSQAKLERVTRELFSLSDSGSVKSYLADLAQMDDVERLARNVAEAHDQVDVLINNAGIFKTSDPMTEDGLDVRFAVNTLAPYLLTQKLLPLLGQTGRVVNLSSAAQAPVNLDALAGRVRLEDMPAYAQSKLAITLWSRALAQSLGETGPIIVAVNPGSLLASKMVKEGFGVGGNDLQIGVDILCRAALSDEFSAASGQYFDNDAGRFATPHADVLDDEICAQVMREIESVLAKLTG